MYIYIYIYIYIYTYIYIIHIYIYIYVYIGIQFVGHENILINNRCDINYRESSSSSTLLSFSSVAIADVAVDDIG